MTSADDGLVYYSLHFAWQYLVTVAWARYVPLDFDFNHIVIDTIIFPFILTCLDANAQIRACNCWRTWIPFLCAALLFIFIARFYKQSSPSIRRIFNHVISLLLSGMCYALLDNFILLFLEPKEVRDAWYLDVVATALMLFALLIQENGLRFEQWLVAVSTYSTAQLIMFVGAMYCTPENGCSYYWLGQGSQLLQIFQFILGQPIYKKISQRCGRCQWIAAKQTASITTDDGQTVETTNTFVITDEDDVNSVSETTLGGTCGPP